MENQKRRRGDRRDGVLLRNLDPLHVFLPYIYPSRADNEAFISERIDLTNVEDYLAKKNAENPEFEYKLFHVLLAAIIKILALRPKMNRFIKRGRIYQRNKMTAAFMVKKQFRDDAHEAMAFLEFPADSTIDSVHDALVREITACREDSPDQTTSELGSLAKLPRFILEIIVWVIHKLDDAGRLPNSLIASDPNHASAFITNLGSIKLQSGYHHLSNFGTNSLFVIIGAYKFRPIFKDNGSYEMKKTVDIGLTVDERIADGYYYAKTMRLLRKLMEHPELLELPIDEEIEY